MAEQAVINASSIEAPSGKGAADENFPVGSWMIAPELRPHVMCYYAFARGTDDIADNPDLAPEEKVRRLDLFDAGLEPGATAPEIATRLRDSLVATGVDKSCARDLLVAFRLDATKQRYSNWEELLDYCRYSAHPVGRYLLQLHGESTATAEPGDALCAALQVINHLQDLGDDRRNLDRVYLPADWMAEAGIDVTALDQDRESPALRQVIVRCLDGVDQMLNQSEPLPGMIRSRRLGAETAVIQCLARRLAARLRREDPLAGRVKHSKIDLAVAAFAGFRRLLRGAK
ncbi:squalene synthase HpnC [Rhodobacteraceae bacterium NNCM2]|nr:squalene synthase HpnC [Coraliihabitans acroporae]